MNYDQQVRALIQHATAQHTDQHATAEEMGKVVEALGTGIALIALGLPPEKQPPFIIGVAQAIAAQVREHQAQPVSDEEFLRDHFNPGVFHG